MIAHAIFGRWASRQFDPRNRRERTACCTRRIVSILDPLYEAGEKDGPVGTARVDLHNPGSRRYARGRSSASICSSGYQYKDGKWQGQLYDPESGKTYKSQITLGSRRQAADARLHRRADARPHCGRGHRCRVVRANIPKMLAHGEAREQLRLTPVGISPSPASTCRDRRYADTGSAAFVSPIVAFGASL